MATSETLNFYRLISLFVDVGTDVLRSLFIKYACPPSAVQSQPTVSPKHIVYNYLFAQQNIVLSLKKGKFPLNQKQIDLVFPPNTTETDIETWDITILYTILRNVCKVPMNELSEIDKLRMKRNALYGHCAQASVSDVDFQTHWADVSAVINNLAQFTNDPNVVKHIADAMNKVQTGPVDVAPAIEVFKIWYERDNEMERKIDTSIAMLKDESKLSEERHEELKTSIVSIETQMEKQEKETCGAALDITGNNIIIHRE